MCLDKYNLDEACSCHNTIWQQATKQYQQFPENDTTELNLDNL